MKKLFILTIFYIQLIHLHGESKGIKIILENDSNKIQLETCQFILYKTEVKYIEGFGYDSNVIQLGNYKFNEKGEFELTPKKLGKYKILVYGRNIEAQKLFFDYWYRNIPIVFKFKLKFVEDRRWILEQNMKK